MTFRQDSSTYYQYIAMLPFFLISSFVPYFLEPASLFYFFISLSFLIFSVFLVFFVFQSFRDCNWITINENGITCSKKGEQLWAYGWDSIAGFETTRHLKESAFEVLLNDKNEERERDIEKTKLYFEVTWIAKKALKAYCPAEKLNGTRLRSSVGQEGGSVSH